MGRLSGLQLFHREKYLRVDFTKSYAYYMPIAGTYYDIVDTYKKANKLSLDAKLVAEARELGVNLSKAAETGLQEAVSKAKAE